MARVLVPLFFLFLSSACATCPPKWYLEKPVEKGYRYGVGKSDPTYIESKAREIALNLAIADLAKQKHSHVVNIGEYTSKASGASGREDSTVYSDTDIKGYEIVDEHMCDGSRGHKYPKGTYFVLIRIKESLLFR